MSGSKGKSTTPDPFAIVREIQDKGPAPVHLWNPPFCGDIDMVIRRDGTWFHEGKPIRRPAMVKLFASILKLESDGKFYLVTPVEKVGIQVEDCPFVITSMSVAGTGENQSIQLTTNTDEICNVDATHPISIGTQCTSDEPHPTVIVRDGLLGLISRAVFYSLVDLSTEREGKLGIWSAGEFFSFEAADNPN